MKKNLLTAIVLLVMAIIGLMLLSRYVEDFELLPEKKEAQVVPPQKQETIPSDERGLEEAEPDSGEEPSENREEKDRSLDNFEESSHPTEPAIPKPNARANNEIGYATRLKVEKGKYLVAGGVFDRRVNSKSSDMTKIFCPSIVKSSKSKIAIQFSFKVDDVEAMANNVFLLAVVCGKKKYLYKPQPNRSTVNRNDNKLVFRNDFRAGQHEVRFGYILKKDVDKTEVPFYSKICIMAVK